jgi:CheY-like chemotaxis protein
MRPSLLIADGDDSISSLFQRFFADHGYRVATAVSGLDCLTQLREFQPNILILDQEVPWGGGEGVLALMRREPNLPSVPVIYQVAGPRPGLIAPPVVTWLLKPVRLRELVEKVNYAALWLREQQAPACSGRDRPRAGLMPATS